MNTLLQKQLNEYDIPLNLKVDLNSKNLIPYPIIYLSSKFTTMYEQNSSNYNAIVDSNACEIIPLEEYGDYLKHICLKMKLPSGYSQAVEEMLDNVSYYINNFLTLVSLDNILLSSLDELEYKEEFIEQLVHSKTRIATSSDYEELKYEIENESEYMYKLEKED